MERVVLGKMDYDLKRPLISTYTDFQSFDVYEVLHSSKRSLASYQKSLDTQNESYESLHPELFVPDKLLFLGGVQQSTLYGEAAYHESIVHPPLITHNDPKRVAIVGGGEGATLREVLRHRSVETAVMIEIDQEVVELSRDFLKEWSDCSDIEGSEADWCLENERVEARFEDALAYFKTKYGQLNAENVYDRFDVVIMDALDPNDAPEIAEELYQSDSFIGSLYRSLTDNGILAVQLGETPWFGSPPDEVGVFTNRAIIIQKFAEVGFQSFHVYSEAHSEITGPWSTLLAFKDYNTRTNWYRNAAEIDLELQKRILPTKSGVRPLKFYDGATHFGYQLPYKAFETISCISWDGSNKCGEYVGFSPKISNIPTSDIKVNDGGGIVAQREIPKNSYVGLDEQVTSLIARPSTWSIINSLSDQNMGPIIKYFEALGACNVFLVSDGVYGIFGYSPLLRLNSFFSVQGTNTLLCISWNTAIYE
jgi:spermidine synthase